MQILNSNFNISQFWQLVAESTNNVLFLDYDGTLAPFREQRDQAFPFPGVHERLKKLCALENSRTVIVSGRSIDDLIPLLKLDNLPEIWGSHGFEHRKPDGSYEQVELASESAGLLEEVELWIKKNDMADYLEKKPASLAVHWRALSESCQVRIQSRIEESWRARINTSPLQLKVFDGGLEFRSAGITKGTAIAGFLSTSTATGAVAYLGDDLTDEDAFEALQGRGVSVLVRDQLRKTAADIWLRPPEELLSFLDTWYQNV